MKVFDEYAQKYDEWYEKPFGSSAFRLELECLRRLSGGSPLSLEVGVWKREVCLFPWNNLRSRHL
jgi:hypothetical protein